MQTVQLEKEDSTLAQTGLRTGNLAIEECSYFHRVATLTSPGTGQCVCNDDVVNDPDLGPCHKTWNDRFLAGQLPDGKYTERRGKRTKRHKVLTNADAFECTTPRT